MRLAKIILAACVWAYFVTGLSATLPFSAAKPVWPEDREKEWNCQAGFTAEFTGAAAKGAVLRYTGATMCRVFLNGEFFGYGPARAAHGFVRVEELPFGGRIKEGLNVLAIEVAGYHCDSFYTVRQPSFLQAEIVAGDGMVLAATGVDGGFSARIVKERVRKVQRFSCQRLYRDVLGVREIDRVNRKVTLRFADVPLDWCEGEIPVEGGWIKVSWRRETGKIVPSFSAPQGWRIAECNCAAVE